MTPEEIEAAQRSVDKMLQSPALKTAEPQGQILMSVKALRNDLKRSEDLLAHIEALEARIAAVRALHEKRDESYLGYPRCAVCMDGEEMALWPCDTISLLDGIE